MAKAEISVIRAIWDAARLLEGSSHYQWGHMGYCNCGFLAQVVTGRSPREIHSGAMMGNGDWSEQLNDYCPSTGMPMDNLIATLLEAGFDRCDLTHLERLTNPSVLERLGDGTLKYNSREDVVKYMNAWASLLEEKWHRSERLMTDDFSDDPSEAEKEYSLSPGFPG